jgi:putative acyl-CoA dehydrogenase
VLLMQIFRDLQRVSEWYGPEEFVESLLDGTSQDVVGELAGTLKSFLDAPPFFEMSRESIKRSADWEEFADTLFKAYQEQALKEVGATPIVSEDKMSMPELWDSLSAV